MQGFRRGLTQTDPVCAAREDGYKLEISDLGRRGIASYPCSENKVNDQLCTYCTADLRLNLFSHKRNPVFS